MGWLFPTAAFNGFGPSAFHGWGTSRATFVSAGNTKTLLKKLAEICPRGQSGVYALVNGRGELYYLGKAKCLRTRLLGYFNPSSRKAKSGRLARPRKSTQALGRLRKLLGARDGLPEGWRVWQLDQIDQVLLVMSWLKNNPQTVGRRLWTCDQADQWIPGDWEVSKGSKQAENRGPVTDCA